MFKRTLVWNILNSEFFKMANYMLTTILLIIVLILIYRVYMREQYVSSSIDSRKYKVLGGYDNRDEAADILATINDKNIHLIQYMTDKYRDPSSRGYVLAQRLNRRYRPDRLQENNPPDKFNTSYTEDKGEVVALCLREKITGHDRLHDTSILEFVDLHEMAHICSSGYGHDDEFWSNFQFLLIDANKAGLHKPQNYSQMPVNYCGLDVEYNPFFGN